MGFQLAMFGCQRLHTLLGPLPSALGRTDQTHSRFRNSEVDTVAHAGLTQKFATCTIIMIYPLVN